MMFRFKCPSCGQNHPVNISSGIIGKTETDLTCPITGEEIHLTLELRAIISPTFSKQELSEAKRADDIDRERWNEEEIENARVIREQLDAESEEHEATES